MTVLFDRIGSNVEHIMRITLWCRQLLLIGVTLVGHHVDLKRDGEILESLEKGHYNTPLDLFY